MRYFSIFWVIIFVLFAALQLNDPDPLVWMPIYLYAALMAGLAAAGKFNIPALVVGAAFYLIGAIYLFPSSVGDWLHHEEQAKSLQMTLPFVEEARESMGLMICFLVLAFYLYVAFNKSRKL
ncbi:MAG: transmembrane 220 family protein [Bacteroidota bacterium]